MVFVDVFGCFMDSELGMANAMRMQENSSTAIMSVRCFLGVLVMIYGGCGLV